MLRKPELYKIALELRKEGYSYPEIASKIKIAKSTLSGWCRHVKLTEEQRTRLQKKKGQNASLRKIEALKWSQEQIQKFHRSENLLLLSGMLLYWAEGTKKQEVTFTNTDPRMIEVMMKFFKEILRIREEKINIRIRIGTRGNLIEAQNFWSKIVKIPVEKFKKAELLVLSEKSKSLEKYPHGICRISVYDTILSRKIAAFIESFCSFMLP